MSVQMRTMLDVADNSGARKLQVILPLGGGLGKKAGLGDVVTAAVKEAYGETSGLYHTAAGSWYIYDRAGLVIRFNVAGTVEGWTIYAWQE